MIKQTLTIFILAAIAAAVGSCTTTSSSDEPMSGPTASEPVQLTDAMIVDGLKETLRVATANTILDLSKEGAFAGNEQIKIQLPKELAKVSATLEETDQDVLVDDFLAKANAAAERAVGDSTLLMINEIQELTFPNPRFTFERGGRAATTFLESRTATDLHVSFEHYVSKRMSETGAIQAYQLLINTYHAIEGVDQVRFDSVDYVTDEALGAIFATMGEHERLIREKPSARITKELSDFYLAR